LDSLQNDIRAQGHTRSRIWGAKAVGRKAVLFFFIVFKGTTEQLCLQVVEHLQMLL